MLNFPLGLIFPLPFWSAIQGVDFQGAFSCPHSYHGSNHSLLCPEDYSWKFLQSFEPESCLPE
jgi:hypothetical protein